MDITRAVLVGCGGISRAWLDAIMPMEQVQLVGLVDLVRASAEERAAQYGLHGVLIETDLERALRALQPDVVFNCTVPAAHRPVALAALSHGCHVLGEKPLADGMDAAREMVAAAQQAGRVLAVIQNRRYAEPIARVRAAVLAGAMGLLTTVNSDFYLGAHFGGFRDRMEHVLLLDMAIHSFDQARFITGADPVAVYCKEWNPAGSWYDHDASAVAIFEMTGGMVYTYRGSWCSEGMNTSWECDWRLIGPNGSLLWDGDEAIAGEVVAARGGFKSEMAPLWVPNVDMSGRRNGHAGVIDEFIQCVRQGGTPQTAAADNIKSLAMVFGAIESAQTGRTEQVVW